ncbi:MAG TPA: 50S ribosomal protein L4 [Cyclobacteriaceae bacterium]
MEISIRTYKGEDTGRVIELPQDIFDVKPNDHAIYLDVKSLLNNKRQGTHKAKERAEIKGSTKKIKRQKGTGTARAGSIKSPIFRGGGRTFGPRTKDYNMQVNKKMKSLARKSVLTYKAKDESISIVDNVDFEVPKTKGYLEFLKNFQLTSKKTLLIIDESNKNVYLSSRNIKNTQVMLADQINTYDMLNADNLIITEKSIEKFQSILN